MPFTVASFVVIHLLTTMLSVASGAEVFAIAKNNSAKASSKYSLAASEPPICVNDGRYTADGTPFHTDIGDPLPWVMLDLSQPFIIHSLRVWNRLDGPCPQRFRQINFGLANDHAVWTVFNRSLFNLCFYYTNIPTAADNPINITCWNPVVGRYLAIYQNIEGIPSGNQYLHFIEIDIFALAKGATLHANRAMTSGSATTGRFLAQWTGPIGLSIDCLGKCLQYKPVCEFALVLPTTGQCYLFGPLDAASGFKVGENFGGFELISYN